MTTVKRKIIKPSESLKCRSFLHPFDGVSFLVRRDSYFLSVHPRYVTLKADMDMTWMSDLVGRTFKMKTHLPSINIYSYLTWFEANAHTAFGYTFIDGSCYVILYNESR